MFNHKEIDMKDSFASRPLRMELLLLGKLLDYLFRLNKRSK